MGSDYNPSWLIVVLAALGAAVGAALTSTMARAADAGTWVWFRGPDTAPQVGATMSDWIILGACVVGAVVVMWQTDKL